MPEFKVKAELYPFSSSEEESLDTLRSISQLAKSKYTKLMDNSQMQLLILADPEAAYLFGVADSIYQEFIEPVDQLLEYEEKKILKYVDRTEVLEMLGLDNNPPDAVEVMYADSTVNELRPFRVSDVQAEMAGMNYDKAYNRVLRGLKGLETVDSRLRQKLSREQRAQELEILEEQLIDAVNHLSDHSDSLKTLTSEEYSAAITSIESTARQELRAYSAMEDADDKVEQAKKLIACFGNMELLASEVASLPGEWEAIRTTYTDRVWNPFIATVMDEEVKKRITTSYREVLIPYQLSKIKNELDCSAVNATLEELLSLHERMYELREEDTKSLERRLRKERAPDVIIELFGIENEER
ncbi:MAG: hypothetical protein P8X57_15100 [Cyclobacteriaceae bacterium]